MFGVGVGELFTIAVVALLIGPSTAISAVRSIRALAVDLRAAQRGALQLFEATAAETEQVPPRGEAGIEPRPFEAERGAADDSSEAPRA